MNDAGDSDVPGEAIKYRLWLKDENIENKLSKRQ